MNDKFGYLTGCVLIVVVATLIMAFGYMGGYRDGRKAVRHEAIEHNYGLHHPKTGKFIWKHEMEKETDARTQHG